MSERQLPTPEDDLDRKLLADVERVGWSVLGIEAHEEGPDFAYSLGIFHTLNHPEILIMGLRMTTAQQFINNIGDAIRAGRRFQGGDRSDEFAEGFPLAFVEVDPRWYRKYVGYARWFYRGSGFPLLQCVWPDKQGLFPWEPEYDSRFFQAQRILGPAGSLTEGWLFPGPPNQVAITTRQVIHEGQPILHVTHDKDDGNWQFLTGDPVSMKDMMIVSLMEIVKRDPSVGELEDLPAGCAPRRAAPGMEWQREQAETETEESQ